MLTRLEGGFGDLEVFRVWSGDVNGRGGRISEQRPRLFVGALDSVSLGCIGELFRCRIDDTGDSNLGDLGVFFEDLSAPAAEANHANVEGSHVHPPS